LILAINRIEVFEVGFSNLIIGIYLPGLSGQEWRF
jgi:hypothetical protein